MTNIRRALEAAAAAGGDPLYVEDLFGCDTYQGSASGNQTITNGLDLDGEGGMVWIKQRGPYTDNHYLIDTERGRSQLLQSNLTAAALTGSPAINDLISFNSNGFTVGPAYNAALNGSPRYYGSWSFRKAEKFFDIQKWTATGTFETISHNLGSAPGFIIYKCVTSASDVMSGQWNCWHSSMGNNDGIALNTNAAEVSSLGAISNASSTQATFYCTSGETYISYWFGNAEADFGTDSDESIIKCGSFTTTASWGMSGQVDLGWEPQFVLMKFINDTSDWFMLDSPRGMSVPKGVGGTYFTNTGGYYGSASTSDDPTLYANTTAGEADQGYINPNQDGFISPFGSAGKEVIYIAIRRPMKVPEAGTEIFQPITYSGGQSNPQVLTPGFPPDITMIKMRNGTANPFLNIRVQDGAYFITSATNEQGTASDGIIDFTYSTAEGKINLPDGGSGAGELNGASAYNYVCEALKRATGFMDITMWTGTGVARTVTHNLGVVPEMMWVKRRNGSSDWQVYADNDPTDYGVLNNTNGFYDDDTRWNDTAPTASVITVGTNLNVNDSAAIYIAILWASVAGVSKVGAYTGTASDHNVNCGFTARYVMVKRKDSGGAWIYLDSARGLTPTPTEPLLKINSNASEIGHDDYIRGHADGFSVIGSSGTVNASGGTYIYLAIA